MLVNEHLRESKEEGTDRFISEVVAARAGPVVAVDRGAVPVLVLRVRGAGRLCQSSDQYQRHDAPLATQCYESSDGFWSGRTTNRRRTAARIVLGPSRSLRTSGRSTSCKRGNGRVTTPTAAGGSMASRHCRHGLPSSRTAPSPPMPLGTPTTLSTTRPLPAPPVLGSSLIRLSGACPMLLFVDLQMLFSPFSAACNCAASPL